jgi:hypothetical protein
MIDTIKLWIASEELKDIDLLSEIPIKFDKDTISHHTKRNQDSVTGRIDNLTISVFNTGISIKGSLSGYYTGNNANTLTFKEIALAFNKLSVKLGIPLEKAKVQRLDIAENYIVDYPVFNYYPYLGDLTYYARTEQNNGIYYNHTNFVISIYDKINEQKHNKKKIIDKHIDANVFRYEFRFIYKVGTHLSKKPVYVSDLLNPEFFKEILDMYINKFLSIYKHKSIKLNPELYSKDRAGFWNHIKYAGLQTLGGAGLVIETINKARKNKAYKNASHPTRIIMDIKKLCKNSPGSSKPKLIEELETKLVGQVSGYIKE